jgi:hypothetical protein
MFFLQRPTPQILEQFHQTAERDSLSYEEVCATLKDPLPSGYHIDHNRTCSAGVKISSSVLVLLLMNGKCLISAG